METTTLKFSDETEYFVNLDKNLLIEIYSFDSSENKGLFSIGDKALSLGKFKLEIHRNNKTNQLDNIFLRFSDIDVEHAKIIANYFESDKDEISKIEEMDSMNMLFSIRKEVLEKLISEDTNNSDNSLLLFSLLDSQDAPILLNFEYYQPLDLTKS